MFRYLGQVGDTLFIMCSAWFLSEQKSMKPDKCIRLILDSFVISIIGLIIASVFMSPSLKEIVHCVFPVTFQTNWFVGCYIIYFLIHPLLNNAVRDLNRSQFRTLAIMMFIAYSVISTIYQSYYFTNLVAFIMMHYLVSYAKKYEIFKHRTICDVVMITICAGLLLGSIALIIIIGNRVSLIANRNLLLCHFYNPLIIGIVMPTLFIAARNRWSSKLINIISGLSLFVYLIHGNYFWQAYGKYYVHQRLHMMGLGTVSVTLVLFVVMVVTSAGIAFLYKDTLGNATGRLSIRIGNGMTKLLKLEKAEKGTERNHDHER